MSRILTTGGFVTLDEIFNEAMDELEARAPGKSQVIDTIQDILSTYDLTSDEQAQLTEQLLSNY